MLDPNDPKTAESPETADAQSSQNLVIKGLVPLTGVFVLFLSLPFFLLGWVARDFLGETSSEHTESAKSLVPEETDTKSSTELAPLRASLEKSFDQLLAPPVLENASNHFPKIPIALAEGSSREEFLYDLELLQIHGISIVPWSEPHEEKPKWLMSLNTKEQREKLISFLNKYKSNKNKKYSTEILCLQQFIIIYTEKD